MSSSPHPSRSTPYKDPLSLVFADIWDPAPLLSSQGFRYNVNFVDAKSNFNWAFPLQYKSQVEETFKKFKRLVEAQCGYSIKSFQSDNALEFKKMAPMLESFGII